MSHYASSVANSAAIITTAADMLAALRRKGRKNSRFAGVILWQGASALDGAPIAVIATRIIAKSKNGKTGHMVQTFVIRTDIHPGEALKTGADISVCGNCPHRPKPWLPKDEQGACYVQVNKSVASVYAAFKRGRYAVPGVDYDPRILPDLFEGLIFRLGSYGDPCAAPFQIWRAATLKVVAKAGYTHQWRDPRFAAFKLLCMASCDTALDYAEATAAGWRTFRVRLESEAKLEREAICPASAEAGHKTSCDNCRACGGTEAKAKVNMVIIAHGPVAVRFAAVQQRLLAA